MTTSFLAESACPPVPMTDGAILIVAFSDFLKASVPPSHSFKASVKSLAVQAGGGAFFAGGPFLPGLAGRGQAIMALGGVLAKVF